LNLAVGYLERELKYESTDAYRPSADTIGKWDWEAQAQQRRPWNGRPGAVAALRCRRPGQRHAQESAPKVFSANGYFDLATPFFATEYDLSHMDLEPALRGNVQFGYYPSGHMIYLNVEALHQLKDDLAAFISKAEN